MTLGVDALTRFQSGTETTPGTAVAATRIEYIEPGQYFKDVIENNKPNEARNSYARNYRSFEVKRHAELAGMKFAPTFELLPRYGQSAFKGGVTGGAGDGGTPPAYTYTFKRTLTSNDLKHQTWEVGDNVQAWQVAGCVLNRIELGFTAGGPMAGSMDWLGLASALNSFTAALSDTTPEDIVGALGKVYIDDSTIGSTLYAYPLDFQFSYDNGWQQLFALIGQITPKENFRPEPSKADLSMKIAFDGVTEYNNFVSHALRKVRMSVDGSQIHGSSAVNKNFKLDWYGKWDAYDMGSENGLHVASLKGESFYDSTFGGDFQIVVVNALAALP